MREPDDVDPLGDPLKPVREAASTFRIRARMEKAMGNEVMAKYWRGVARRLLDMGIPSNKGRKLRPLPLPPELTDGFGNCP